MLCDRGSNLEAAANLFLWSLYGLRFTLLIRYCRALYLNIVFFIWKSIEEIESEKFL